MTADPLHHGAINLKRPNGGGGYAPGDITASADAARYSIDSFSSAHRLQARASPNRHDSTGNTNSSLNRGATTKVPSTHQHHHHHRQQQQQQQASADGNGNVWSSAAYNTNPIDVATGGGGGVYDVNMSLSQDARGSYAPPASSATRGAPRQQQQQQHNKQAGPRPPASCPKQQQQQYPIMSATSPHAPMAPHGGANTNSSTQTPQQQQQQQQQSRSSAGGGGGGAAASSNPNITILSVSQDSAQRRSAAADTAQPPSTSLGSGRMNHKSNGSSGGGGSGARRATVPGSNGGVTANSHRSSAKEAMTPLLSTDSNAAPHPSAPRAQPQLSLPTGTSVSYSVGPGAMAAARNRQQPPQPPQPPQPQVPTANDYYSSNSNGAIAVAAARFSMPSMPSAGGGGGGAVLSSQSADVPLNADAFRAVPRAGHSSALRQPSHQALNLPLPDGQAQGQLIPVATPRTPPPVVAVEAVVPYTAQQPVMHYQPRGNSNSNLNSQQQQQEQEQASEFELPINTMVVSTTTLTKARRKVRYVGPNAAYDAAAPDAEDNTGEGSLTAAEERALLNPSNYARLVQSATNQHPSLLLRGDGGSNYSNGAAAVVVAPTYLLNDGNRWVRRTNRPAVATTRDPTGSRSRTRQQQQQAKSAAGASIPSAPATDRATTGRQDSREYQPFAALQSATVVGGVGGGAMRARRGGKRSNLSGGEGPEFLVQRHKQQLVVGRDLLKGAAPQFLPPRPEHVVTGARAGGGSAAGGAPTPRKDTAMADRIYHDAIARQQQQRPPLALAPSAATGGTPRPPSNSNSWAPPTPRPPYQRPYPTSADPTPLHPGSQPQQQRPARAFSQPHIYAGPYAPPSPTPVSYSNDSTSNTTADSSLRGSGGGGSARRPQTDGPYSQYNAASNTAVMAPQPRRPTPPIHHNQQQQQQQQGQGPYYPTTTGNGNGSGPAEHDTASVSDATSYRSSEPYVPPFALAQQPRTFHAQRSLSPSSSTDGGVQRPLFKGSTDKNGSKVANPVASDRAAYQHHVPAVAAAISAPTIVPRHLQQQQQQQQGPSYDHASVEAEEAEDDDGDATTNDYCDSPGDHYGDHRDGNHFQQQLAEDEGGDEEEEGGAYEEEESGLGAPPPPPPPAPKQQQHQHHLTPTPTATIATTDDGGGGGSIRSTPSAVGTHIRPRPGMTSNNSHNNCPHQQQQHDTISMSSADTGTQPIVVSERTIDNDDDDDSHGGTDYDNAEKIQPTVLVIGDEVIDLAELRRSNMGIGYGGGGGGGGGTDQAIAHAVAAAAVAGAVADSQDLVTHDGHDGGGGDDDGSEYYEETEEEEDGAGEEEADGQPRMDAHGRPLYGSGDAGHRYISEDVDPTSSGGHYQNQQQHGEYPQEYEQVNVTGDEEEEGEFYPSEQLDTARYDQQQQHHHPQQHQDEHNQDDDNNTGTGEYPEEQDDIRTIDVMDNTADGNGLYSPGGDGIATAAVVRVEGRDDDDEEVNGENYDGATANDTDPEEGEENWEDSRDWGQQHHEEEEQGEEESSLREL